MRPILLVGLILFSACDSGGGGDDVPSTSLSSPAAQGAINAGLKLYAHYEYGRFNFSTCGVDINNKILTLYSNSDTRQFRVLNAKDEIWYEGTYSESGVFSFQEELSDGKKIETADCVSYLKEYEDGSGSLRRDCESTSWRCSDSWKRK